MVDLRIVIAAVIGVVAIKFLPLLFTVPLAIAAIYIYVFIIRFRDDMQQRPYLKKTYGLVARHSARLAKNIAVGGKFTETQDPTPEEPPKKRTRRTTTSPADSKT